MAARWLHTLVRRNGYSLSIRTQVICDGVINIQAGAGVMADSQPSKEWEETLNKARAMLRAVSVCS